MFHTPPLLLNSIEQNYKEMSELDIIISSSEMEESSSRRNSTIPEIAYAAMGQFYSTETISLSSIDSKLDNTTTQSFTCTLGLTTFSLGSPSIPASFHWFILSVWLIFFFIETSVYRQYVILESEVLLIRKCFYGQIFKKPCERWLTKLLQYTDDDPKQRISMMDAAICRFKNSYYFLLMFNILGWMMKNKMEQWQTFVIVSSIPTLIQLLLFYFDVPKTKERM